MSAEIIDGKAIAEEVRREVAADVAAWVAAGNEPPGLATVLVGDDPASAVYVGGKQKATHEVGMQGFDHRLPADTPQADVEALLGELNGDPRVSGILLQLPTPDHIDGGGLTWLIDPAKDVDGLTPVSAGLLAKGRPGLRPCTPAGCMELLDRHALELEGAEAVVVGRADVLVAAVGRARMVQGDWVKPGAAVIDVGINRAEDGLVGDVDFDAAAERAALITPVPRGVGPMTIAMLLRNTLAAARARARA